MSLRSTTITCMTTPSASYSMRQPLCMTARAIFDPTGMYRYSLWREWCPDSLPVAFIMLNPSTADDRKDDPTIRRCIGFAHAWGFGALEVVNLFAYRATDSRKLIGVDDPVGPENDGYIMHAVERCSYIVVAWGTKGVLLDRNRQVIRLLAGWRHVGCLGVTKDGHPRHPLYVRGNTNCWHFIYY